MNNECPNKLANTIIYFLTILLICLILYNLFSLINRNYASTKSHRNSIEVGPISIKSIYINYSYFQNTY